MSLRISVITPSFNQAAFLPRNLASVTAQTLKPVEHIVYDPGSTDESRSIAADAPGVTLVAEPDKGQADAVARGMREAKGEIIAWLNSDDEYYDDGVFAAVAEAFEDESAPDIVFGNGIYIGRSGEYLRDAYVIANPRELGWRFAKEVGILQPATFISKKLVERIGPVDPDLDFCMDYEFWIRAHQSGAKFLRLNRWLARARYYEDNKTLGLRRESLTEVIRTVKNKFGFAHRQWVHGLADFELNKNDGILRHFGHSQTGIDAVKALGSELIYRANGDHATVGSLRKNSIAKNIVGNTLSELDAAGLKDASHYASPVADGEIDPPRTKGYLVGEQRWAFNRKWLDVEFARSDQLIETLKRQRKGDTCVIAGNGPSLNRTDFDALSDVDVFITNYAFINQKLASVANFLCVTNYLVAEQEAESFNLQRDFIKFTPYWLSYCLLPTAETCYIRSVGVPEFGRDYRENISWRSTVSFFAMQLAYTLGYRRVLLVGFDHSYTQPISSEGDLIEQKDDDPNHFDPRYFKGKSWQAADTDNMESMYRLAKEAFEADDREIVNCTVGGRLEIFRRGDLADEISEKSGGGLRDGEIDNVIAGSALRLQKRPLPEPNKPRLLLIDMTRIADGTATGELKANLFADWPQDRLAQVYAKHDTALDFYSDGSAASGEGIDPDEIASEISAFKPDVILYRPVADRPRLHKFAMSAIERLQKPLVTWVMDDWPTAFAAKDPAAAATMERDWRSLLSRSAVRLSISNAMSKAFKSRYDLDFVAVANGIDPDDWPELTRGDDNGLTVRYAGSLAENMTLSSIRTVAQAVERLADGGIDIKFEIKTRELWRQRAEPLFKDFKNTKFVVADLQPTEYRSWLADADITVIAYNFDDVSKSYVQYSLANKLPECLASGAPLLAVGPRDVATMATLENYDIGVRVTNNSVDDVAEALKRLSASPDQRHTLGAKARDVALQHFNVVDVRKKLAHALYFASRQTVRKTDAPEKSREDGARVDETAVVAHILSGQRGRDHTMLDVGAHFGSSAAYFHELDWTIHCFEPDPANRKKLEARWGASTNISIDPRAVSDRPATGASFFSSVESTGISSLGAFRDTHKESARVDITTVGEIVEVHQIKHIDFLKIDVEGFDLSVLKGVPWDQLKPDVIECEFEDAKTVPMGHTWQDIADFLVVQGYKVYISEWHPIVRYGIPHDWRRVVLYNPAVGIAPDAWGNLLAFKNDPGLHAVQSAFDAKMQVRTKRAPSSVQPQQTKPTDLTTESANVRPSSVRPQQTKPTDSTAESASVRASAAPIGPRPFYAHAAERLQKRSPLIYTVARLVRRGLAAMWRRRLIVAPFALFIAFTFFTGLAQPELERKLLFSGGAAMLGISIVVLYLGWWTYHRIRVLTLEMSALRRALEKERKSNSDVAAKQ